MNEEARQMLVKAIDVYGKLITKEAIVMQRSIKDPLLFAEYMQNYQQKLIVDIQGILEKE